MAINVPASQVPLFQKLLELPDQKIDLFLALLSKAGPKFNVFDLASEVSGPLGIPEDSTVGIFRILAGLYMTRKLEPVEEFVDRDVFTALKKANTFAPDGVDAQWKKLRKFLVTALSLERTVGTTVKAGPVLTQHERIFNDARIMTDLRPIFHLDVSEKPDAAVIIHMLKINHRNIAGQQSNEFFALDSNDLIVLRAVVDRAMKKERALKDLMRDSSLKILDPKMTY